MSDEPGGSDTAGQAAGGRRGRGLSAERIARTALAIIDEQGIGEVSMRAIATRLGVKAMSLYKHIATRDLILDAVVELVVRELDADPQVRSSGTDGWRDYLERLARGVRRYARVHPQAFPLVTTRPAQAPWVSPPLRSLAWIESLLAVLTEEGFTGEQVLFAYRSFNSFLLGYLLMETGAMTAVDSHAAIDPARYPVIHQLASRLAEEHFTEEFERALQDMLDRIGNQIGSIGQLTM